MSHLALHLYAKPIKVHAMTAAAVDSGSFGGKVLLTDKAALGAEIFSLRRKELPEACHLTARNRLFKAQSGWHMHCTVHGNNLK
jgi:hypothetical protein